MKSSRNHHVCRLSCGDLFLRKASHKSHQSRILGVDEILVQDKLRPGLRAGNAKDLISPSQIGLVWNVIFCVRQRKEQIKGSLPFDLAGRGGRSNPLRRQLQIAEIRSYSSQRFRIKSSLGSFYEVVLRIILAYLNNYLARPQMRGCRVVGSRRLLGDEYLSIDLRQIILTIIASPSLFQMPTSSDLFVKVNT